VLSARRTYQTPRPIVYDGRALEQVIERRQPGVSGAARCGILPGFEPMICRDDADAIAKARRLVDGHDVEIWNCERFVLRLVTMKRASLTAPPRTEADNERIRDFVKRGLSIVRAAAAL
jgi:hypothetical protein